MEDREIIQLYFCRDEAAIAESDTKYGKYCFSVTNNILMNKHDSEECVNDTWLRAWHVMPLDRPAVLQQFFAKITRNLSLDRYRAARSMKRGGGEMALALEELSGCISGGADPACEAEKQALQESMLTFLGGDWPKETGQSSCADTSIWRSIR
jgi:RNA polymerase sigma-70 factor (ECF subfamily)